MNNNASPAYCTTHSKSNVYMNNDIVYSYHYDATVKRRRKNEDWRESCTETETPRQEKIYSKARR